ncbi:hypothetical protein ABTY61_22770 [Kitasatospora sp. NPDC096128]|uniref:hypothetical protein n=1 Tax=Kitasatospora sp. NPDC096128 TaxID=3155547 RepID=UPI0033324E12
MDPVRIHTQRILGWTLTLTTSPTAFASLTLHRPHTPDPEPDPWRRAPQPAAVLDLTLHWRMDDLDSEFPPLQRAPRPLPARLRAWLRPHPSTTGRGERIRAFGPWTARPLPTVHGLSIERLPEHDCPTHTLHLYDDEDLYDHGCPEPDKTFPPAPTPCTCPRYLGFLSVSASRPERHPTTTTDEPPF